MIEHVCCGFRCETDREMAAHKKECPEVLRLRSQKARVVRFGGWRIVAGHPDAVARYWAEREREV